MYNLIKDIPSCERPYEKALKYGVEGLSDAELIAVILRTGTRDSSSIALANRVLDSHHIYKGLISLNYVTRSTLMKIKGIGDTKATQLLAISELSKRMNLSKIETGIAYNNPSSIAYYYMEKCKFLTKEVTYLMLLTSAHTLIKEVVLSEGTINQALISTREIFIEALKFEAVNMILVHNHPSGNPKPSKEDVEATKRIAAAAGLLDLHLSDHIIVGHNGYFSMLERGII